MPVNLDDVVAAALSEYNIRDCAILVAVSGGKDSMVLLHILHRLSSSFHLSLHAIHVNHGLRGHASDLDADFVVAQCEDLGVPVHVRSVDVHNVPHHRHSGLEAAARAARYDAFLSVCQEHSLVWVLTAHTQDDNVETVLMNLIRGTGLLGLTGIPTVRPLRKDLSSPRICRPLLAASTVDVLRYADLNSIDYRHDQSNDDVGFLRNQLRHGLIPQLRREFGPDVISRIDSTSHVLRDAAEIVSSAVESACTSMTAIHGSEIHVNVELVKGQTRGLRRSLIHYCLKRIGVGRPDQRAVRRVESLWDAEIGSRADVHADIEAFRDRDSVVLRKRVAPFAPFFVALESDGSYVAGSQHLDLQTLPRTDVQVIPSRDVAFLDVSAVHGNLVWRSWQSGDQFVPHGSQRSVLVADLLSAAKVPLSRRPFVSVVEDDEGIVWLCGIRPAERVRVTSTTTTILQLHHESITEQHNHE